RERPDHRLRGRQGAGRSRQRAIPPRPADRLRQQPPRGRLQVREPERHPYLRLRLVVLGLTATAPPEGAVSSSLERLRDARAERAQEKPPRLPRTDGRPHAVTSRRAAMAAATASRNASGVHGANLNPVPLPEAASNSPTVSSGPPVACTTGTVPYRRL